MKTPKHECTSCQVSRELNGWPLHTACRPPNAECTAEQGVQQTTGSMFKIKGTPQRLREGGPQTCFHSRRMRHALRRASTHHTQRGRRVICSQGAQNTKPAGSRGAWAHQSSATRSTRTWARRTRAPGTRRWCAQCRAAAPGNALAASPRRRTASAPQSAPAPAQAAPAQGCPLPLQPHAHASRQGMRLRLPLAVELVKLLVLKSAADLQHAVGAKVEDGHCIAVLRSAAATVSAQAARALAEPEWLSAQPGAQSGALTSTVPTGVPSLSTITKGSSHWSDTGLPPGVFGSCEACLQLVMHSEWQPHAEERCSTHPRAPAAS